MKIIPKKANEVMGKHGFIHLKPNDATAVMNEYVDFATDEDGNEYNYINSEMQYHDFGIIINRDIYIVHIESGTTWKNISLYKPEYELIKYCKKIIDKVILLNGNSYKE